MHSGILRSWRANFLTGLAVVFPGALSILVVIWLFRNISYITDTLLIFLPKHWTHENQGHGPFYWYSSPLALITAVILITLVGRLAREYIGQKLLQLADDILLRVPLLNKIYGTLKQVNEALTSNKKSSFKQVVLVEFPRAGTYSIGFVTGEQMTFAGTRAPHALTCVFVPTTPNPTSGFIVMLSESQIIKLDMPVSDGIKFIISLGSLSPDQQAGAMANLNQVRNEPAGKD